MKIKKQDSYTILSDDRDDITKFAIYLEHIVPKHYEKSNLVIDLLKFKELKLHHLLLFLKLSNYQRSTKHSFVLVNETINIDEIPDELTVAPTLEEAGDIVEMEEIERDLGF